MFYVNNYRQQVNINKGRGAKKGAVFCVRSVVWVLKEKEERERKRKSVLYCDSCIKKY